MFTYTLKRYKENAVFQIPFGMSWGINNMDGTLEEAEPTQFEVSFCWFGYFQLLFKFWLFHGPIYLFSDCEPTLGGNVAAQSLVICVLGP